MWLFIRSQVGSKTSQESWAHISEAGNGWHFAKRNTGRLRACSSQADLIISGADMNFCTMSNRTIPQLWKFQVLVKCVVASGFSVGLRPRSMWQSCPSDPWFPRIRSCHLISLTSWVMGLTPWVMSLGPDTCTCFLVRTSLPIRVRWCCLGNHSNMLHRLVVLLTNM